MTSSTATILLSAAAPTVLTPREKTYPRQHSRSSTHTDTDTDHQVLALPHLRDVPHAAVNHDDPRAKLVHAFGDDAADDSAALAARLRHNDAAVRRDEVGEVRPRRERAGRLGAR